MGHRVLHLSDIHVSETGPDEDGVDAVRSLGHMLAGCEAVVDLDLIVVTGDVSDDGSIKGCATVRERIGKFARRRRIPHIYTTGNHDDRTAFAVALGSGHIGADGTDVGSADLEEARAAVSTVGGLRVITLDSLVPGKVHGDISDAQLDWLSDVLTEPAPEGSILALHHPPISTPAWDYTARDGLHQPERLAARLNGSDVRAILCGHLHLQLAGMLANIPVWVTPGVVTRIDHTEPIRAVLGASATVVDLLDTGPVFHLLHARDPRVGEQVYVVDGETLAD